jgi:Protein of unknown function (DUF3999)
MKAGWGILAAVLIAGPSIAYFRYERPVQAATSNGQHYAMVDEYVWVHARGDLSDLRLYASDNEMPYTLTTEMGVFETEQKPVRILQPGTVGGKTQFLLDMSGAAEYDRVELKLATRNFVVRARMEGQDEPHGKAWITLGTTTLYDLTDEKLGHNSTLQIPLSGYKYLRVTVDGAIKPSEIESARAGTTRAEKAVWREVRSEPTQEQKGRDTVFTFSIPKNVPVERIRFDIDPAQQNFQRGVEIQSERERPVESGELSRIRMQRNAQKIDVDETSLAVRLAGPGKYRIVIRNGDDVPLKISGVGLQQFERRIYFDSEAGMQARLYYGDYKLGAPVYDYKKLFQKAEDADQLQLEAEILNSAYTGRPDERPWSERYPALLWGAIVAAVLLLGGLAYRSVRAASA